MGMAIASVFVICKSGGGQGRAENEQHACEREAAEMNARLRVECRIAHFVDGGTQNPATDADGDAGNGCSAEESDADGKLYHSS